MFTEQILYARNCARYFTDTGTDAPQHNFVRRDLF